MRYLALLLLSLASLGQGIPRIGNGGMVHAVTTPPIALGTHVSASSAVGGNITTGAIDTTGYNFLVAGCAYQIGQANTLSDSKSNTWTSLTERVAAPSVRLYYVANATVGSGHTFTCGAAGNSYPGICVSSFANVKTASPADQQNGTTGTANPTIVIPSITPAENNELVIGTAGFDTPLGVPVTFSGMTVIETRDATGVSYGCSLAYVVQTTAAAIGPTVTFNMLESAAVSSASFKAP